MLRSLLGLLQGRLHEIRKFLVSDRDRPVMYTLCDVTTQRDMPMVTVMHALPASVIMIMIKFEFNNVKLYVSALAAPSEVTSA